MLLPSVLLIVGLIILVKGADWLVEGSSSIAKKMKISEIVIGLTLVAFGTSCPELVVNVFSSFRGNSEIAFGNIVGSNICNVFLILGIAGLIRPIQAEKNTIWKEIPFSLLAGLVLLVLGNDKILLKAPQSSLSLMDGIILFAFFTIFLFYIFRLSKVEVKEIQQIRDLPAWKTTLYIVIGLGALFVGGKLVVDNAVLIAQKLQISERVIALTIIAGGTSLPELATSCVAAYKGKHEIAIGNVVGSNIFNIFFILAISCMIAPIPFEKFDPNIDLLVLTASSLLLFLAMFTGKRKTLDRWEAGIFLAIFIAYTGYLISNSGVAK